jgi:hypothetical protein
LKPHPFRRIPFLRFERSRRQPLSPTHALTAAFHDTVDLLVRPLDATLWLKLSLVCLLLGGGTPSAAFNWTLGSLPGDVGLRALMARLRETVAAHTWLIVIATLVAAGLIVGLLYLRSVFRFVLVDAIFRRDVRVRSSLRETRRLGHSYFRWLLMAVIGISLALIAGGLAAFPYLRAASAAGLRSPVFWVVLVAILLADVAVGLTAGLVIVLTDDFVVPVMYAERLPVFAAWRRLTSKLKADPGPFTVYVVLRFGVAVVTSVAILFLLFPLLVGLFSGAIITGTLVVLTLHLLNLVWTWNPLTIAVGASGLALVIGLLLAVLSVVGMPAQVLIQDFGIRFIASHFPSVEALLPSPPRLAGDAEFPGDAGAASAGGPS